MSDNFEVSLPTLSSNTIFLLNNKYEKIQLITRNIERLIATIFLYREDMCSLD